MLFMEVVVTTEDKFKSKTNLVTTIRYLKPNLNLLNITNLMVSLFKVHK